MSAMARLSPFLPLSLSLSLSLLLSLACLSPGALATSLRAGAFARASGSAPRMFFLGDSLMDTGNSAFNAGPEQNATCNWAPYGMSLSPAGPTGRCTDGLTVPDLICAALGIPTPPPVLQPGANFANGASMATCGAATTVANKRKSNFTGDVQVDYLRRILWPLGSVTGVVADVIAVVEFGAVDLTNFFRITNPLLLRRRWPAFSRALVQAQRTLLQRIYNMGVRNIVLANLGPAGCIPLVREEAGIPIARCLAPVDTITKEFNAGLEKMAVDLRGSLTDARIVLFDTYAIAFQAARLTGLSIAGSPCCGTGTMQCGTGNATVCSDPSKFFYWDNWHPTQGPTRKFFDLAWAGNTTFIRPINAATLTALVQSGAPVVTRK